MRIILDFCTTSRINITNNNVLQVLSAANRFGFAAIEKAASEALAGMLNMSNHLEVWCFANQRMLKSLCKVVDDFVSDNIMKIMNLELWLEYPVDLIKSILSTDLLKIYNESQLYEGIMKWVKHDNERRIHHLPELFALIRLEEVSLKFLYHVIAEDETLLEQDACRETINREKDRRTLPRLTSQMHERTRGFQYGEIFIVGGLGPSLEPCSKFERFLVNEMKWEALPDFAEPIWGSAAITVEGCILLSGGEGTETKTSLHFTNPGLTDYTELDYSPWQDLSPMSVARFGHGMAECMGWAYVIGGYNSAALSSCEMYDIHSDRWSNISPLNFARDGPGVVSLYNTIYACGGYNSKDYKVVERYDPRVGMWERVPNMENARSYGATAVADGKIFCFGGRHKEKKIYYTECYDPRASKWESLDNLVVERSDSRAVAIGKTIYLMGGLDKDNSPLRNVECYNIEVKEWVQLQPLTSKRRLMAVVSVGN